MAGVERHDVGTPRAARRSRALGGDSRSLTGPGGGSSRQFVRGRRRSRTTAGGVRSTRARRQRSELAGRSGSGRPAPARRRASEPERPRPERGGPSRLDCSRTGQGENQGTVRHERGARERSELAEEPAGARVHPYPGEAGKSDESADPPRSGSRAASTASRPADAPSSLRSSNGTGPCRRGSPELVAVRHADDGPGLREGYDRKLEDHPVGRLHLCIAATKA